MKTNKPAIHKISKAPRAPVRHLSFEEVEKLLQNGIPQEDLPRYRHTVYASNASFWHLLFLLDQTDELVVGKDERIFSKIHTHLRIPA